MHSFAVGLAIFLALAIIAIGMRYVASPLAAARSFGLRPPAADPDTLWWLRLKGVRDIASGVAVLALLAWGPPGAVGILLLADALIPLGDMLTILAARGSTGRALGIHGTTAAVMVLAAWPLIVRGP